MQPFRTRPFDVGRTRATYLALAFGRELRIARMTAGVTQARLAELAAVSQAEVSKAERGRGDVSLEARCRLAAACGHELGWRLYPMATVRLRDSGQLSLAQAIMHAAHGTWRARLEVPVAPGDRRAADLVLAGNVEDLHIEVERALVDVQAQLRSGQLKREALAARSARPVRLVLAVPDTKCVRMRLAPFAELIGRALPTSSASTWRAIRRGEPLGADGILFVRAPLRG
jgi:transcriptional regulator with XRE-family HTH domain